jgi:putative transposase
LNRPVVTIKKECLGRQHFATRTEACDAIAAYIDGFYNSVRRHSTLQYLSPIDYEQACATTRQAA